MKVRILHLSHTDIRSDSRILKETQTVANERRHVHGIGIHQSLDTSIPKTPHTPTIYSIKLHSKRWTILPRLIRHVFSAVEFYIKMFLESFKFKPHVVHCHDTYILPLGVILKLLFKSKLIYDAHELESDTNSSSTFMKKLIFFTEKRCWKYIDALIVVSPSIKQWYNEKIGKKHTEIILNAPVAGAEAPETKQDNFLRKKFNIPNHSKIFIYVGLLRKGRGIEAALEIFRKPNITSHLVFLGKGELRSELLAAASQFSNIHVCDAVPHEQVISVARSADIGLCFIENISLSDYYCLPNKLFEYSFSGLPVIASNFPDLHNTITEYHLGKTCDLSSESIFKIIKEYENMETIPKINHNNLYDLSWGAQAEKLNILYEKIINQLSLAT